MKTLNIEDAIRYEISDTCFASLSTKENFQLSHEREGEINLKGDKISKGIAILELITATSAELTKSFGSTDDETRLDFRLMIVPDLLRCQSLLATLRLQPQNENTYWELIDILGKTLSFQNRYYTNKAGQKQSNYIG